VDINSEKFFIIFVLVISYRLLYQHVNMIKIANFVQISQKLLFF